MGEPDFGLDFVTDGWSTNSEFSSEPSLTYGETTDSDSEFDISQFKAAKRLDQQRTQNAASATKTQKTPAKRASGEKRHSADQKLIQQNREKAEAERAETLRKKQEIKEQQDRETQARAAKLALYLAEKSRIETEQALVADRARISANAVRLLNEKKAAEAKEECARKAQEEKEKQAAAAKKEKEDKAAAAKKEKERKAAEAKELKAQAAKELREQKAADAKLLKEQKAAAAKEAKEAKAAEDRKNKKIELELAQGGFKTAIPRRRNPSLNAAPSSTQGPPARARKYTRAFAATQAAAKDNASTDKASQWRGKPSNLSADTIEDSDAEIEESQFQETSETQIQTHERLKAKQKDRTQRLVRRPLTQA